MSTYADLYEIKVSSITHCAIFMPVDKRHRLAIPLSDVPLTIPLSDVPKEVRDWVWFNTELFSDLNKAFPISTFESFQLPISFDDRNYEYPRNGAFGLNEITESWQYLDQGAVGMPCRLMVKKMENTRMKDWPESKFIRLVAIQLNYSTLKKRAREAETEDRIRKRSLEK